MGGSLSKTFSRHGSMSLRGRPKLFGGAAKDKDEKLAAVPQGGEGTSLGGVSSEGLLSGHAFHERTLSSSHGEEKGGKRGSLFGLGRKKSNAML